MNIDKLTELVIIIDRRLAYLEGAFSSISKRICMLEFKDANQCNCQNKEKEDNKDNNPYAGRF